MKTLSSILIAICVLAFQQAFAQNETINGFNYQAVARDLDGNLLADQTIGLKITVTEGLHGQQYYGETHRVKTDMFGLFHVMVGEGDPVSGDFTAVNWSKKSLWLHLAMDIDGGDHYKDIAASRISGVPYAMEAGMARNVSPQVKAELSDTRWHEGVGDPDENTRANSGDYYLNIATGEIFNKQSGGLWVFRGTISTDGQPDGEDRDDPNDWTINGNSGTTAGTNFLGTTDAQDVVIKANNSEVLRATTGGVVKAGTGTIRSGQTGLFIGEGGNVPQVEFDDLNTSGAIRYHKNAGFQFFTNGGGSGGWKQPMVIRSDNGNVGICAPNPDVAAKLEIGGQIKITGGSPGLDKVLTSDSEGLGAWVTPADSLTSSYKTDSLAGTMGASNGDFLKYNGSKWAPTTFPEVAFHAVDSTGQMISGFGCDTVKAGNEIFDLGDHFDPTNWRFTAPKDGVYSFNSFVTLTGISDSTNVNLKLKTSTGFVHEVYNTAATAPDNISVGLALIQELALGEEVWMEVCNGHPTSHSSLAATGVWFSGKLDFVTDP